MNTFFPKYSKRQDGDNIVMEQKLLQQTNNLVLNTRKCVGCGICADACPEEAIAIGPVGAVRRGAINYGSAIDVDESRCSYCGVCTIMCPFNALSLLIDGEDRLPILEKDGFPQYDMVSKVDDEKCVRCTICSDVCPRDAINRDVPEYEGTSTDGLKKAQVLEADIKFEVDDEKCTYCGICGSVCPAIDVEHKPFTPEKGVVEGAVHWDEKLCDGCQVCAEACPSDAITVVREVSGRKLNGKVDIVEDDCCTCRWCAISCPQEAITVEKIFEGEINFNAEKCPGGCSTCVDVCPANAIYLPSPKSPMDMHGEVEANIAVNKDFCVLCGACVNACPGEDIIVLKRTGIRIKGEETDLFKKIKAKLCTTRTSKVHESVAPGEVEVKVLEESA